MTRTHHDCPFWTTIIKPTSASSSSSSFIIIAHFQCKLPHRSSSLVNTSSSMHPADPASTTEAYVAPNINQPNAPLQGYMSNAAPPAFNNMTGYANNFADPSVSVQPYSQQSLPMDTSAATIQFLDPATLSNYPVTTQEIIKRYSENAAAAKGTPEWEAAREQVMRSVGSSEQPMPGPILSKPRGRPRGRPRKNPILQPTETHTDVAAASRLSVQRLIGSLPASSTISRSSIPLPQLAGDGMNTPTRGRGRGRPRGRGSARGGRGGKRKRSDEDADVSDEVRHSQVAFINEYKLISPPLSSLHRLIPTILKHISSNPPQ